MGTKNRIQISLNNALRYLYYTAWNRGVKLMAIEFEHGGRSWRADTVEEAISLRRHLEAADIAAIEAGEEPDAIEEQVWTPDAVNDLLTELGQLQKLFLCTLFEEGRLTTDKVLEKLNIGHASFAGVLSGLSKQLKKQNIKPWQLYNVRVEWDGKTQVRTFSLSTRFKWAAKELGWPEKWV